MDMVGRWGFVAVDNAEGDNRDGDEVGVEAVVDVVVAAVAAAAAVAVAVGDVVDEGKKDNGCEEDGHVQPWLKV